MAEHQSGVRVAIGCQVRVRSICGRRSVGVPPGIEPDDAERVLTIVPAGQMGLYKLSPRTPLGGALLGRQAGEVVSVSVEAGTVGFEILAVDPVPSTVSDGQPARAGGVWRWESGDGRFERTRCHARL